MDAKELHEKREFAKEAARYIQEEKEKGTIEKVKQKELKQLEIATSGNTYTDQHRKVRKELNSIRQLEAVANLKSLQSMHAKRKTDLIIKNIIKHKGHEVAKL